MEIHNSFPSKWWWWCRDFFHQFTCRKRIFFFFSQKNFFQNKKFSKKFSSSSASSDLPMNTRKKKKRKGGDRSLTVPTYANDRLRSRPLNKEEEEKKRNQSCWFPSSSCRLEKKKKSHFHLPTSAAGRLFISRLRSERHDPADKFQSSSFAYSSASSLFFFILLCYLLFVCDRRRFQQRPPAGHQSPAEFYWPPNAVDIIRLARRRAASKGASFEYFNYLCTGMINLTPSIDKQLR